MLEELIAEGEGTRLEFKSTIDSAWKIARTLVAFANTSGGKLVIGVTDDGQICGVQSESAEIARIEAATDYYCDPPLTVSYQTKLAGDNLVLLVDVGKSPEKPHNAIDPQGVPTVYIRTHNQNLPAGKTATQALLQETSPPEPGLLESRNVKTLMAFLEEQGSISAKRYAKLINISDRRAARLLEELTQQGVLLMYDNHKDTLYSLK